MVTGVNSKNNSPISAATTSAAMKNTLGQDAFLKLMVAELQNQDPLEPKQDKEFIAQLAQFSNLEQMTTLNNNFEKMLAATNKTSVVALLGNIVEGVTDAGDRIEGIASSIRYEDGKPLVNIVSQDGTKTELPVENVTQVFLSSIVGAGS